MALKGSVFRGLTILAGNSCPQLAADVARYASAPYLPWTFVFIHLWILLQLHVGESVYHCVMPKYTRI